MNNGEETIVIDETPTASNKESETFNDFSDSMDIDELLIEEVSKHEVLFNYSIPLQQRNRAIINETWIEVSKALGDIKVVILIQHTRIHTYTHII